MGSFTKCFSSGIQIYSSAKFGNERSIACGYPLLQLGPLAWSEDTQDAVVLLKLGRSLSSQSDFAWMGILGGEEERFHRKKAG